MSDTKTAYRTRNLTATESKTPQDSNPSHPSEPEQEPKPKLLDLSPVQLTGGALAAMTSAVVGARLGVAGTVLGAAVGSVVAGVAGTLYTASLRRTKDKISSVIVSKTDDTEVEIVPVSSGPDAVADPDASTRTTINDTRTLQLPLAADPAGPLATVVDPTGPAQPKRRRPWKTVLVSTAAVFALAFAAITTFEILTGHAISGGQGTTITQVSEGRSSGTDKPSKAPATAPSSQTSDEPTTSPATSEPTSEPTTEAPATTEPTQSPVPSTTDNPSTSGGVDAATSGTGTSGAETAGR